MTGTRETAAQLDGVIDVLLHEPPGPPPDGRGELTATARLLRDSLPRLHPRVGFEEWLAARLAAAARPLERAEAAEPTPIRRGATVAALDVVTVVEAAERRRRGLLTGGAIASGVSLALPIAGAALVVWRRSRSSGGLS
ncbi:MAG TPA: hypothetical protein VK987_03290 [Anaerolineae bacterium]|nr:hypothetical protein [Anaerolineae bacterium]